MGDKTTDTKTTNTSQGTTSLTQTPTNPTWVDQGLGTLGSDINNLSTADPFSFVAGPDALQSQAGAGAANLATPGGFGDAAGIANKVAGADTPSIASHLAEFQNPYTDQVVNTTLKGFDQNAGYSRAGDTLARANDPTFGGSSGAIQTALNEQNIAQSRAQTEAQLRDQGFQTALGGATSQASLDAQSTAQRLAAAGVLSGNATATGANDRANIGTQSDIGAILQQLAQQRTASPLALLATRSGLYGSTPLNLLHGQTSDGSSNSNSTGTSDTTVSDPMGSIASLMQGGGALAQGLAMFSDRRLKRDAICIGERADGLRLWLYRYLWSPAWQLGVMAQEVLKVKPEAVLVHPSGYLMVNYGAL